MGKNIGIFTVLLLTGLGVCQSGFAQSLEWVLDCKFYRVLGNCDGETSLTDPIWSGVGDTDAEAEPMNWIQQLNQDENVTVFNLANLTNLGGLHFIASATGWSWNGAPEPPWAQGFPQVEGIASPKIASEFGQSFVVAVNPSDPVEYFEAQEDGSYRVAKSDVETGIRIGAAAVEQGPNGRVILRDFEVQVSTITDREPLKGTTLDIGKPIVDTQEFLKTFSIQPGLLYGLNIRFENYGSLLVQLRLTLK